MNDQPDEKLIDRCPNGMRLHFFFLRIKRFICMSRLRIVAEIVYLPVVASFPRSVRLKLDINWHQHYTEDKQLYFRLFGGSLDGTECRTDKRHVQCILEY